MNMMISLLRLERRAIRLLIICRCGKEKGSTGFDFFRGSRNSLAKKAWRPSPALIIHSGTSGTLRRSVIVRDGDWKRRVQ
ncbi:hypothetical protein FJ527_16095 [Mesorhizobium sp. B2-4-18]|uniref:hypothetical protein n=1 Tax=Mesorhizobium sp. B2-4-18 TaxID=2589931 RepID=UPI0011299014|nr:hypothetical protein [Mesorhizobium sp. B2-4-18]TPK75809.1 hypothetical protein FJ527_16095 [Mesorhizobium sp. B2-4-18]